MSRIRQQQRDLILKLEKLQETAQELESQIERELQHPPSCPIVAEPTDFCGIISGPNEEETEENDDDDYNLSQLSPSRSHTNNHDYPITPTTVETDDMSGALSVGIPEYTRQSKITSPEQSRLNYVTEDSTASVSCNMFFPSFSSSSRRHSGERVQRPPIAIIDSNVDFSTGMSGHRGISSNNTMASTDSRPKRRNNNGRHMGSAHRGLGIPYACS